MSGRRQVAGASKSLTLVAIGARRRILPLGQVFFAVESQPAAISASLPAAICRTAGKPA